MHGRNLEVGRALTVNRARIMCFEDPVWDDRLEKLVKVTQRTSLIIDLTGTDAKPARIKAYTQMHLQASGIAPSRPRGTPRSYESKAFLKPHEDRLDAAYLVALHFGPRGPGEFSEVEADLGQALDKRLEVYGRYCSDLYPLKDRQQQAPRLCFEDYVQLIQGIKAKVIALHVCRECGACHPYSTVLTVRPSCPFCKRMNLDMGMARFEVERRLQQHRSRRPQHLTLRHRA
jgi:hypothetical protein